jgi:hypothetical protein
VREWEIEDADVIATALEVLELRARQIREDSDR